MAGYNRNVYVSCIKINGKPILPPLLDDSRREEMRHYRDLAISVELKLREITARSKVAPTTAAQKEEEDENLICFDNDTGTLSPTLTASTDLNQFFDSTLDASSPLPSESATQPPSTGRLIRSTSYTLDQPSASLLAAVEQDLLVEPYSAFEEESKCFSYKPPKKFVAFRKRKKLLASSRSWKKYSQSAKKEKESEKCDDIYLDLDLHLDLPICSFVERYDDNKHAATQIDQIEPSILTLDPNIEYDKFLDISGNFDCTQTENCNSQHQSTNTSDEIFVPINDLINPESVQQANEDSQANLNAVPKSQSTPEFSRATQTDLSPSSLDTSVSELEISQTAKDTEELPNLMANIQLEYEKKLNYLMKLQEEQKNMLKEQFLQQQEILIKKLSLSPRTPVRSPPIHKTTEAATPRKPLSPALKQKFCKLPALVRGYLTRRLMKTERIQNIKATVRETLSLAVHLHSQEPPLHPTDIALHGRLIQQLDQALAEFHDIFFALPRVKQLKLIAMDRDKILRGASSARSSTGSRLSSATMKAQQRRQQRNSASPNSGPNFEMVHSAPPTTRMCTRMHEQKSHRPLSERNFHTNGSVNSDAKFRRHADRQSSLPKNKRPWR